jgi:hypothetical protein
MNAVTAFLVPQPVRMFEPRDMTDVVFAVAASADFDRRADRLAADLAAYRARCDAALTRIQEPTPC